MPESRTSPRRIAAVERQRQALELRMAGNSFPEIARSLGYKGASGALYSVEKALDRVPAPEADRFRKLNLRRLDKIIQVWWPVMVTGVTDVDGEMVIHNIDDRLKATDRILKAITDLRALYGLDVAKPVPGSSPENPIHTAQVSEIELTMEQVEVLIALDEQKRAKVPKEGGRNGHVR